MHRTQTAHSTVIKVLWPATEAAGKALRLSILALVGTAALTLSAKVQVPFYPVPQTMQTFVVLVLGMAFGWRLGAATIMLYLAEGAMGLPVFAGTGGTWWGSSWPPPPAGGSPRGAGTGAGTPPPWPCSPATC
jgi:biotin transport system substrate-specific component